MKFELDSQILVTVGNQNQGSTHNFQIRIGTHYSNELELHIKPQQPPHIPSAPVKSYLNAAELETANLGN